MSITLSVFILEQKVAKLSKTLAAEMATLNFDEQIQNVLARKLYIPVT